MVAVNGEVLPKEKATVYVREYELFVTVKLLEDKPAVLALGNSAKITGIITMGQGQKPFLIKNGRKIDSNTTNYVPFVVPGLTTSSSSSCSSTSPTNSMEYPASTRSESISEEAQGNLSHEPAETENPTKNEDNEKLQSDQLRDVPDWPQEFRHEW